jgi:hypothetical protein
MSAVCRRLGFNDGEDGVMLLKLAALLLSFKGMVTCLGLRGRVGLSPRAASADIL